MLQKNNSFKLAKMFFEEPRREFHLRELARLTQLSTTSVSYSLNELLKEGIVTKKTEKQYHLFKANRENDKFIRLKYIYNIYSLSNSGLIDFLKDEYEEPEAIVVFGSYSKGEDISKSDIDIAIVTKKRIKIDLKKFEKTLKRKISIYEIQLQKCEKEFINNLANGIVLYGYLKVI